MFLLELWKARTLSVALSSEGFASVQCHSIGWCRSVYDWALSAFSKYTVWLNEETLNHQVNRASFVGMCITVLSYCHQSSWCCHVNQRLSDLFHLHHLWQFISCDLTKGFLLLALQSFNMLLSGTDPRLCICLSGPAWRLKVSFPTEYEYPGTSPSLSGDLNQRFSGMSCDPGLLDILCLSC